MKPETGVAYARSVVSGEIRVCKDVKLACRRFLDMIGGKHADVVYRERPIEHFLQFVSMIKHVKGPDAGKPLVLEPFQIMIICAIYGFRWKYDLSKRVVQDVIIFIPRKAGKSTLTAAIALYELQFSEVGAEVFTLATNRDQASIVFNTATGFISAMPAALRNLYKPSAKTITKNHDPQTVFTALSRDTKKTGDGKNPSCVIVDEAAQITDRNSIEVLHSGMVARKNPLRVYITTASFTKETKFYEDFKMMQTMLSGFAKDNPRWFGMLYSLDEGDDWRDKRNWSKANPMHGISVFEEAIEQRAYEAGVKPQALNEFLCKTLNLYVSANSAWIDREYWDKSVGKKKDEEPESSYIGFDLAETRDVNAVCTLHRYGEEDYYAEFKMFLPEESLGHIPNHYLPIFRQAVQRGSLVLTQGNVVDHEAIGGYIKEQCYKLANVVSLGYDAYNAAALVAKLNDEGLPLTKVGQSIASLSAPAKHVASLIMKGAIKHDGDPFVSWCVGNCEAYVDLNGNVKVRKNEADNSAKIDPVIAMIIAMHRSLDNAFNSTAYGVRFITD